MKNYVKELEKHKESFTAKKTKIEREDGIIEIEGLKTLVKKYPESKEATTALIKKWETKILKETGKSNII